MKEKYAKENGLEVAGGKETPKKSAGGSKRKVAENGDNGGDGKKNKKARTPKAKKDAPAASPEAEETPIKDDKASVKVEADDEESV